MNTASLELCKELYKLSGWEPQDCAIYALIGDSQIFRFIRNPEPNIISMDYYIPAYDLGYLLRKLPDKMITDKASFHLRVNKSDRFYSIFYDSDTYGVALNKVDVEIGCAALTPEDAACSLAIELFKQGVLKSEEV